MSGRTWRLRAPALALRLLLALLRRLSVRRCSDLGGGLLRRIGPLLPVDRVAEANLRRAMPELDAAARRRIRVAMWDNLGRTAAELAHLHRLQRSDSGPGWEIEGEAHLRAAYAQSGQVLFFSGHLGNWELIRPIAAALGIEVAVFYRAASNPYVDAVIQQARNPVQGGGPMFAKGAAGAQAALRHLAQGGSLGMLVDQKMNDGIAVPFFGRPAMTAPALAQFALRRNCPLLPVRVRRIGPVRFRLVCEPPLALPDRRENDGASGPDQRAQRVLALCTAMNATLERWIREEPDSWLWMHRRWPKG